MIPVIISVIGDIDRTPVYPSTEFTILDKPTDKQLLSNDKLLYQLPNTIDITTNELPEYVEYYENGTIEVDSGILDYTINDNLAYINYIEAESSQVIDGELIVSKPTQIISKSSNLYGPLDFSKWTKIGGPTVDDYYTFPIDLKPNTNYTFSGSLVGTTITGSTVAIFNSNRHGTATKRYFKVILNGNLTSNITFNSENDSWYLAVYVGVGSQQEEQLFNQIFQNYNIQLNEGTEALPYQPFTEHFYNLDNGIELYKLPNGVGDIWYQDGTLERNVGVIDTVNNYAEYGTLPTGTYDNILEFINDNQNKQIKIFFNDNIQESRYNIYLENDTIIINNDTEVIRIYNDDSYTSTRNLDTDITYKLEGYNIVDYIDGELDNTVLAFFWIIPVLLAGGLIYLLLKRKE